MIRDRDQSVAVKEAGKKKIIKARLSRDKIYKDTLLACNWVACVWSGVSGLCIEKQQISFVDRWLESILHMGKQNGKKDEEETMPAFKYERPSATTVIGKIRLSDNTRVKLAA